jgi:hypothetical protein
MFRHSRATVAAPPFLGFAENFSQTRNYALIPANIRKYPQIVCFDSALPVHHGFLVLQSLGAGGSEVDLSTVAWRRWTHSAFAALLKKLLFLNAGKRGLMRTNAD